MERIWLHAPMPALCVRAAADGAHVQFNEAARAWLRRTGALADELSAVATRQAAQALALPAGEMPPPAALRIGPLRLRCTAVPLRESASVLLWLQPDEDAEHEAAARVRRTAEFLDRALLLAGISVWRIDLATRRIHFNALGFEASGAPQDPAGLDLDAVRSTVHPDDVEAVARAADEAVASERVVDLVARYRKPDGSWRTLLTRRLAERDAGGRAVSIAGVSIDLTQHFAERERRHALELEKQRLEQATREKSTFMARMSHELRTPMNAILGFTQLLLGDREQPPLARQAERLAHIDAAGRRLMAMIDELLAIARREALPAPAAPAAGLLHVLCVEDNPVNLQLVRELMALRPQVRLRTAEDGISGVQAALSEPPDLLLLDLQLPDIDGLEVMRRVRAQPALAGCRIVALSADAMPGHIEAAMAAGFDDYWTKPIQFDHFLAHIDRLAAGVAVG